ncbi:hypothetical protein [Antrihabitans stalactiti]|uniref:DNA-binding protein n=1 Tax=Antrihabitans stalactiti TaxID=2584121 RepID=A0A848KLM5_9NOCA|nr:hypothetical protein [Antrihabitans stalactiti]
MGVDYSSDAEARFLHGKVGFETALSEIVGAEITRADLVRVLHTVAEVAAAASHDPVLSVHDETLLDEAGFTAEQPKATITLLSSDLQMRELVRSSLTVNTAAERLGVSPARIRQRIADHTVWAYKSGQNHLLPAAQFIDNGTVPHLDKVAPLIPGDLHPLSVHALLTRRFPELVVDDEPASIIQFLSASAGSADDITAVDHVITAAVWESA